MQRSKAAARATAVLVTSLALVLINVALALLIVTLIGATTFAPAWLAGVLLALGLLAAAAAIWLWRDYVRAPERSI